MINKIFLLFLLIIFAWYPLKPQDAPKNIIVIDENISNEEDISLDNIDENFGHCVDGLVVVDLGLLKAKKRARYITQHKMT